MTEAELEQWALAANWSGKRIDWLRLFLARFAIVPVVACACFAMGGSYAGVPGFDSGSGFVAVPALVAVWLVSCYKGFSAISFAATRRQ
jgi:hypothetical protein